MSKKVKILLVAMGIILLVISLLLIHNKKKDYKEEEKSLMRADKKMELTIGDTVDKGIWTQTTVYPDNIDDTFVIDICLPDNYDAERTYPAVYLTDCYWRRGDYPAMKALYETGKVRDFILVGIGYPDDYNFDEVRIRDLIDNPRAFLKLIIEGVIPYVEGMYKIDASDRSFLGASCGGYFMVYSLFQSDGLTKGIFKNYLINSPAFNYYERNRIDAVSLEQEYYDRGSKELVPYVYMTVGGLEDESSYIQPLRSLSEKIKSRNYSGLTLDFEVYEGLGHYEVWVPTLLEGLSRCFK